MAYDFAVFCTDSHVPIFWLTNELIHCIYLFISLTIIIFVEKLALNSIYLRITYRNLIIFNDDSIKFV